MCFWIHLKKIYGKDTAGFAISVLQRLRTKKLTAVPWQSQSAGSPTHIVPLVLSVPWPWSLRFQCLLVFEWSSLGYLSTLQYGKAEDLIRLTMLHLISQLPMEMFLRWELDAEKLQEKQNPFPSAILSSPSSQSLKKQYHLPQNPDSPDSCRNKCVCMSITETKVSQNILTFKYSIVVWSFPGSSVGKKPAFSAGEPGFNPWVEKIPWRRKRQTTPVLPGNPIDRGAWWATAHGRRKSWARFSNWTLTAYSYLS